MEKIIHHPNELFDKISGILVIDLMKYAIKAATSDFGSCLKEPELGIYQLGSATPLISEKVSCYSEITGDPIALEDILTSKDNIVDNSGVVILKAVDITRMKKYLSITTSLPATGISLALAVATNYLFSTCRYSRSVTKGAVVNLLKEGVDEDAVTDQMENVFSEMLDEIFNFIGDDIWHIYFHRVKGSTLVIEKTVDWRIYDWHKQKHDALGEDNDYHDQYGILIGD